MTPKFDLAYAALRDAVIAGTVPAYTAGVDPCLLVPFDASFNPCATEVGQRGFEQVMARAVIGVVPMMRVYQKGRAFVVSTDYLALAATRAGQPNLAPCIILGQPPFVGAVGIVAPLAAMEAAECMRLDIVTVGGVPSALQLPEAPEEFVRSPMPAGVPLSRLRPGPYQHAPFEGVTRRAIQEIVNRLREVDKTTFETWEDGFRRDLNAEREIAFFRHLGRTYSQVTEGRPLSLERKGEIYRALSLAAVGGSNASIDPDGFAILVAAEIEALAREFWSGEQAPGT